MGSGCVAGLIGDMSSPDRGLVQPILVGPDSTHLETISAVMVASTVYLMEHRYDPAVVEWLASGFTKSVRQVNATKFAALLDPETPDPAPCTFDHSRAAAFSPMRYDDFPPLLHRARVSGLDRERVPFKPARPAIGIVFLNADLEMSTGKSAAQAAHALNVWALDRNQHATVSDVMAHKIREVDTELFDLACQTNPSGVIHDAGHTEIVAGSATAVRLDSYSAMQWVRRPLEITGADAEWLRAALDRQKLRPPS